MQVGYASGVFDLFHMGHLNVLRRSRLQCDYLIAGVTCDSEVMRIKGHPAAQDEAERMEVVQAVRYVDQVHLDAHAVDKMQAWRDLRFDIMFKGGDWKGTPKGDRLEKTLGEVGVRVIYLPYTTYTSSSMLRATLGMA